MPYGFSQNEYCRLKNAARLKYAPLSYDDKTKCFIGHYHFFKKNPHPDATEEMHIAYCAFLHLELKLFLKIKYFFCVQVHNLDTPGKEALTASIRGEFPIHKFNEILMEYFDAAMASSEGNVMSATEFTMDLFKRTEKWLCLIRPGRYS